MLGLGRHCAVSGLGHCAVGGLRYCAGGAVMLALGLVSGGCCLVGAARNNQASTAIAHALWLVQPTQTHSSRISSDAATTSMDEYAKIGERKRQS